MLELEFQLTSYCQAKCPTCSRTILDNRGLLKPEHVNINTFKNIINKLDPDTTVTLCGELGDPMMHPDIEEIVKLFLQNGNWVQIHTNGALSNKSFYEKYATDRRVAISWGIDGMDAETNGKYRIGVNFKKAWNNMHTWFTNGGKGHWNFIIFKWNKHQLYDAYEYAKTNNIPIEIKINNRIHPIEVTGYVGDEEFYRLRRVISELK